MIFKLLNKAKTIKKMSSNLDESPNLLTSVVYARMRKRESDRDLNTDDHDNDADHNKSVEDPASRVVKEEIVPDEGFEPTTPDTPSSSTTRATTSIVASENPSNILFADSLLVDCKEINMLPIATDQ